MWNGAIINHSPFVLHFRCLFVQFLANKFVSVRAIANSVPSPPDSKRKQGKTEHPAVLFGIDYR